MLDSKFTLHGDVKCCVRCSSETARRESTMCRRSGRRIISRSFRSAFITLIVLAVWHGSTSAQSVEWNDAMNAASKAMEKSQYGESEKWLRIAIGEAEKFGPRDRRLAETLTSLGFVLYSQGKYVAAETVYKRALEILENAFGRGHLRMVDGLT